MVTHCHGNMLTWDVSYTHNGVTDLSQLFANAVISLTLLTSEEMNYSMIKIHLFPPIIFLYYLDKRNIFGVISFLPTVNLGLLVFWHLGCLD